MILDGARPNNARIRDQIAHKDVSVRCLEVIKAVKNERVAIRDSPFKSIHGECGSCTSSNPVVQRYGALSETPDVDPSAQRAEDCALRRGHCHVVVYDDGALHGPLCKLAKHTDAHGFCVRPSAIDRVVRNQIRTRVCDANRLGSRRCLRRHGTCRDHVPLYVHSSVNAPKVDRGLSRVLNLVPRNVHLDLGAGYSHTEYEDPHGIVKSSSSSKVDAVISDHERSGHILWLSRVRWHGYTRARNDIDSVAATKQWLYAIDLAGGDHQSADGVHKNRVSPRTDKAQSPNRDAGSGNFDIEGSRSPLNTRQLPVLILGARDRDFLRHQDRS